MNPLTILMLAFLLIPLVEIYFLIQIGEVIGSLPTIFLVVFTAVLGVLLLRYQGWVTLRNFRASMDQGHLPAMEMMEGIILLLTGALLLTPGFFTDAIGFTFLVPSFRRFFIRRFLSDRIKQVRPGSADHDKPSSRVIEGEYRREDD